MIPVEIEIIGELVTVNLHHFSHRIVYEEENAAYYDFDKRTSKTGRLLHCSVRAEEFSNEKYECGSVFYSLQGNPVDASLTQLTVPIEG
jgi:hypothetical protein